MRAEHLKRQWMTGIKAHPAIAAYAWHVEIHTGVMSEDDLDAFVERLMEFLDGTDMDVGGGRCNCPFDFDGTVGDG